MELPKESIDFMCELAITHGQRPRGYREVSQQSHVLEDRRMIDLNREEVEKRGKKVLVYKLPINLLKNV